MNETQANAQEEPHDIEAPKVQPEQEEETKPNGEDTSSTAESGPELNGKADAEEITSSQDEEKETKTSEPKRRARDRIAQLVAQKRQAEAEADSYKRQFEKLSQQIKPPSDDATQDEIDRYNLRQVMREERASEISSEAEANAKATRSVRRQIFEAKLESAADRMPDVVQKFAAVNVSEDAADFIAESDKAPELANFLGSNPHKAHEIYQMPAIRQVAELARLEARLSAAPQAKKATQAPKPVSTIKGGSASGHKKLEDMTMAEYSAWASKRDKRA